MNSPLLIVHFYRELKERVYGNRKLWGDREYFHPDLPGRDE